MITKKISNKLQVLPQLSTLSVDDDEDENIAAKTANVAIAPPPDMWVENESKMDPTLIPVANQNV